MAEDQVDDPAASRTPAAVVARRIKEHRELLGITQTELAEQLRTTYRWGAGKQTIDRSVIARIETRKRQVSVDELFLLAAALSTSPALLLTPASESEVMDPTPVREMTSSRVRAWVAGEVRLWEQDPHLYELVNQNAWERTQANNKEMDRVGQLIADIYGVDSIHEVDRDLELPPRQRALVEIHHLRFEIAIRRYHWEIHIGQWPHADLRTPLMRLDAHCDLVAKKAQEAYGHLPIEEVWSRQAAFDEIIADTHAQAREILEGKVAAVLTVVDELVAALPPPETPVRSPSSPDELPQRRATGGAPA